MKLTQEEKSKILALREKGRSIASIAQEIGCSVGAVGYHCLRNNAEPPKTTFPLNPNFPAVVTRNGREVRRFTPDEDRQLIELDRQGLSYSEIGRRLNRLHNSIIYRLCILARREERAT